MSRQSVRPKYLKKYDVSPQHHTSKKYIVASRKVLTPLVSVNVPRTKDLLGELISSSTDISSQSPNKKIDKYFTISS